MKFLNKILLAVFFINTLYAYSQLAPKECNEIRNIKLKNIERFQALETKLGKTQEDSQNLKLYQRILDSMSFLSYPNRMLNDDWEKRQVIDSNGWHIPDSIAEGTRFGKLKNGESVDLYYMKPIIVFYDSTWEQNIYFDMGSGKYPRGFRSLGPCTDTTPNTQYSFYGTSYACQCNDFYRRLGYVYDIPYKQVLRLAVKGRDMRYMMFRRITFTKLECYYEVQYYEDIFTPDSDNRMLKWYTDKFKNRQSKDTFEPVWIKGYLQNSTLTFNTMVNVGFLTSELEFYSSTLCKMEYWQYGSRKLKLPKSFINDPSKVKIWHQGIFMLTWQIMDFGDGKPESRRYGRLGDYIMYRHPLNRLYYDPYTSNFENKDRNLPYFKTYDRDRRLMYYKILRYPYDAMLIRMHNVTVE